MSEKTEQKMSPEQMEKELEMIRQAWREVLEEIKEVILKLVGLGPDRSK